MAAALHTAPGMGYKHNAPLPNKSVAGLEKVACRTKCGEVELKITLVPKFLAKTLRDALIEPFLKVHNKRAAAPVSFEELKCIKVDGFTLEPRIVAEMPCEKYLLREDARVQLLTSVPASLLDALAEVSREAEEITMENYYNKPLPPMSQELLRTMQRAADVDLNPPDADTVRRAGNAFETLSGGEAAVSGAAIANALTRDEYVRGLWSPANSPHLAVIVDKIRRMAVSTAAEPPFDAAAFTQFFAALSAAACAPADAGHDDPAPGKKKGQSGPDFLQQLMDDDSCTVKRVR